MSDSSVEEQTPREMFSGQLPESVPIGTSNEIGRLIDEYRPYLMMIAMAELPSTLQGKVGASDIVQETIMKGFENYGTFRGTTREELAGWLRTIFFHVLANYHKIYRSQKRDLSLEVPTEGGIFFPVEESPSQVALSIEQRTILDSALSQLPKIYREVILLRHRENLTFMEIGIRMQKSEDAARKTWVRALHHLKQELRQNEPRAR